MTESLAIRLSRLLTLPIPFRGMRKRCRHQLRWRLRFPPGRDESFACALFRSCVRYVQEAPRMVTLPTSDTPLVSVDSGGTDPGEYVAVNMSCEYVVAR